MDPIASAIAIETTNLSKRYKSFQALQDCSITLPAGSITALVGANGAGKTTLLQLLAGLNQPTSGAASIFGKTANQSAEFVANIGFLAQEIPLYKQLTAEDYVQLGKHLNQHWDETIMHLHLNGLDIPLDKQVGKLSGGQRAQVALAFTLAKQPKVLLLDEPVASLDPLARRDFLAKLATATAENRTTTIMSHKRLVGRVDAALPSGLTIIQETRAAQQRTCLVKIDAPTHTTLNPAMWQASEPSLEDIVFAYMSADKKPTTSGGKL
jgi:ABC-2 type transport system ATP-binding protein